MTPWNSVGDLTRSSEVSVTDPQNILDVLVIGAGPAGMVAAAVVAEAGLDCLAIDPMGPGGQLMNLGRLHDCPDLPEGTTGPDLLGLLVERATAAGAELGFGAARALKRGDPATWIVSTDEETWRARAIVIATGLGKGTTGLADETRFEGRGLSHCANCDGPLYKDQPVVVHGDDRWALTEAIELAGVASAVTLVVEPTRLAKLAATDAERLAFARAQSNVHIAAGGVTGFVGDDALAAVDVAVEGGLETVSARALFLLANRRPASDLMGLLVATAGTGATDVGRDDPRTVAAGVFAAGDVVAGAGSGSHGIPEAIADGERAGQNAVRWVRSRQGGA